MGLQVLENTLESFRAALALGIDQLEFDVRVTKDNELVVIHDATVDRTTDGTGLVCEKTFEELRKLRLLDTNCQIPTFEEFLQKFSAYDLHFAIELKGPDVETESLSLIKKFGILHKTTFTSFQLDYIKKIKTLERIFKDLTIRRERLRHSLPGGSFIVQILYHGTKHLSIEIS